MEHFAIFADMLQEIGITVSSPEPYPKEEPEPQPLRTCCGQQLWEYIGGELACPQCGKVHEQEYMMTTEYWSEFEPCGSKYHMVYVRKRYYKPLTHFKEHLRRYMGARFTELPDHLWTTLKNDATLDCTLPDAYTQVKDRLKRLKMSKYYKEIFMLIYSLGGQPPKISNQQYLLCIRSFERYVYTDECTIFKKYLLDGHVPLRK